MKKPWFGVKAYGIGIGPKSFPGWVSVLVYAAAMGGATPFGEWLKLPFWRAGAFMLAMTVGLLVLMAVTSDGKPWRWRWGGR